MLTDSGSVSGYWSEGLGLVTSCLGEKEPAQLPCAGVNGQVQ